MRLLLYETESQARYLLEAQTQKFEHALMNLEQAAALSESQLSMQNENEKRNLYAEARESHSYLPYLMLRVL